MSLEKKIREAIILVSACGTALLILFLAHRATNVGIEYMFSGSFVMGVPVVSEGKWEDILEDLAEAGVSEKTMGENTCITFHDTLVPYDSGTRTLYISQPMGRDGWEGNMMAGFEDEEVGKLYILQDDYCSQKKAALHAGHAFQMLLVQEDGYYQLSLVASGMPVINIDTDYSVPPQELNYEDDPDEYVYGNEEEFYGEITVFDPELEDPTTYQIFQSQVHFHQKGALSSGFPKHGYSLHLTDDTGNQESRSLLGLRKDDDWKLNALYTDPTKVREITAAKLWKSITKVSGVDENGPDMEYAEVIMDGEYAGLYTLVEPVDAKQCNLDTDDVLYKVVNWELPDDAGIQESIDQKYKVQYPVRLRYPGFIVDYEKAWYPMRDYLNSFYREADIPFEQGLTKVNIRNVVDFNIFLSAAAAYDNSYKNVFYSAHVATDGSYTMVMHPWDLDYTFGNYNVGDQTITASDFLEDYTVGYMDECVEELAEVDRETMKVQFMPVWESYRDSILKTETLQSTMEKYQSYIIGSGAMARDTAKWPDCGNTLDIESLLEYVEKRLDYLDQFWVDYFK